jgi:hypothetical protein
MAAEQSASCAALPDGDLTDKQRLRMPHSSDDRDSNIDLPASPFTIVRIGAGDGVVRTYQGLMSIDEAAELLVEKLRGFNWDEAQRKHQPLNEEIQREYELILDVTSLVAEINLYQARALWNLNTPRNVGEPRMLSTQHELQELRYLSNLQAQRGLNDDELASHILEQGAFMSDWAEARRQLIVVTDGVPVPASHRDA